jgi:hypothetical protein
MENTLITNTITVARRTFDVIAPLRDGSSDVFNASVFYRESSLPGAPLNPIQFTPFVSGGDVVPVPEPVPEPLTIFGTAIGLGGGILFKRKSFKKTIS